MKKRINELLKEQFQYETPELLLSAHRIDTVVNAKDGFRIKLDLEGKNGAVYQGIASSSNYRLKVKPEVFAGRKTTLTCVADTRGLQPGEVLEGEVVIGTTLGEERVPYQIQIESEQHSKKENSVLVPEIFAALARHDFAQAYVKFAAPEFAISVKEWGDQAYTLYRRICEKELSYHSLDQFLTGLKLKMPVEIRVSETEVSLPRPETTIREEILLFRENWGFSRITASSDADFLTIERPKFTTEEFTGSVFSLGYLIHHERLHAGRNFAGITIRTQEKTLRCVIEVQAETQMPAEQKPSSQTKEIIAMLQAYISWYTKRMDTKEWAEHTLQCLNSCQKKGGDHIFYDLYRIYVLQTMGETIEADVLLEEIQKRKEELVIPQWKGFYLFLTCKSSEDKVYTEYVKNEIQDLFLKNQENWIIQWLRLHGGDSLFKNDTERLEAIRSQYLCGCKSPILYLEAWKILDREPLMLRTLGDFELHLLHFLCRNHLLDPEICGQTAQLAGRIQTFHPLLYRVLCKCYEKYPTKNLLTAICSILMKGHKTGAEYAHWFEQGVKQDIRLAGLYEYYAMTADDLNIRELPTVVRMYFSYHSTLNCEKKAAIYANIIKHRQEDPDTYETYRPAMVRFIEEQLKEGKISSDLAILYDALLEPFMLNEQMTKGLAKALYTYEIFCENPQMHQVIVFHRQLGMEQRVALVNARAYVQIYSPECVILLENAEGICYADASFYQMKRLLEKEAFVSYCRELSKIPDGVLLHDCIGANAKMTSNTITEYVQLMQLPVICSSWKKQLQERLLQYYAAYPQSPFLNEYLEAADLARLCRKEKRHLIPLLLQQGLFEKAYELVKEFGPESVDETVLVRLFSWYLEEKQPQEDVFLLDGCMRCFRKKLYNETILRYLMRYYEGALETMKTLWRAGKSFLLEEFGLEEKILVLLLFYQQDLEETEEIFASYKRKQGKSWLCKAYVILMSYQYFVKEKEIGSEVFDYIEVYLLGEPQNPQICSLAILKHYTEMQNLSAGQQKWLFYLLDKFIQKGMYFRFYQKLPQKLLRRYHLHDKYILEYRTDPKAEVSIHYSLNGEAEKTVSMQHMYEGIFVKTFILFYHDRMNWHLTVKKDQEISQIKEKKFLSERRSSRGAIGRFELLNRMTEALQKKDEKQLQELQEQYIGQQYLVDELFRII